MKLTTDIKARGDGTVNAVAADGTSYDFKPDGDGRLVADVRDKAHAGELLNTGNFYPAEENDTDEALEVAGQDGADLAEAPVVEPIKVKGKPGRKKKQ